MELVNLHYCDVYRSESGRCHTLPFFLTFFIILPFWFSFCIRLEHRFCKFFCMKSYLLIMLNAPPKMFFHSLLALVNILLFLMPMQEPNSSDWQLLKVHEQNNPSGPEKKKQQLFHLLFDIKLVSLVIYISRYIHQGSKVEDA